ncbi:TerC/Alx family metal homeostasis membrane protein [Mycolicibacterium sp. 120270]|uniref:TerC/Alx family metal homeostasis membrane protein n=1 Tax=Mycolicibacterium sp. 120270 TaxID=3090600 RepID=UPI00299D693D|nr:TerC/Alx family metal homeostasis membrane protein [Mycolicibacterium sp. 120270]MDX1883388.1 TerC/Alx family metal homeostasis membrane protein [Mycolicibacterium sp. 120270]
MISVVSPLVWAITVVALVSIMVIDLAVIGRRQRTVTTKDAVRWVLVYVALAVAFAVGLFIFAPGSSGQEFVAGYITEYSLSVDNLFVFMIIMARFAVPELAQDKVLYIGIVLSLVFRAVFIFAGAAAIAAWSWVFYVLGGFLVYTAIQLALEDSDDEPDFHKSPVLRFLRRILPISENYDGRRLVTRADRPTFTPLVIVIAAIGMANVVFALDSIPAIFGLTNDAYIIFTANALALMGLRQLYFLIGGLLEKVVYLSKGLAVILGFIGVKLIVEALHHSHLDHVGDFHLPEIGIVTSLLFIVVTLTVTTVLSLIKTSRDLKRAGAAAD